MQSGLKTQKILFGFSVPCSNWKIKTKFNLDQFFSSWKKSGFCFYFYAVYVVWRGCLVVYGIRTIGLYYFISRYIENNQKWKAMYLPQPWHTRKYLVLVVSKRRVFQMFPYWTISNIHCLYFLCLKGFA